MELIEIHINGNSTEIEETKRNLQELVHVLIEKAQEANVWSENIEQIVISENFHTDVNKQIKDWNLPEKISSEKEGVVVCKNVFNHDLRNPIFKIFLDYKALILNSSMIPNLIMGQVCAIKANELIPTYIREQILNRESLVTLNYLIKIFSENWCKSYYSLRLLNGFGYIKPEKLNLDEIIFGFKRRLKRQLYEFYDEGKKNKQLDFIISVLQNISYSIERLIENDYNTNDINVDLLNRKTFEDFQNILKAVRNLATENLQNNNYDVSFLKKSIVDFFYEYEIVIKENENSLDVELSKNPKDYFKGDIVDTEPRIVCFMDILGFSNMIEEYDTENHSITLQNIHKSFKAANDFMENMFSSNSELIKHLEHKSFSDCVCISIPFFNNNIDFVNSFNIIAIYVRYFQYFLMQQNIFLRGGISTGSYFSDSNIIFSKGLVKAYKLESKIANYPRIIIDKEIIARLISAKSRWKLNLGFHKSIIIDWEGNMFINPFGIASNTIEFYDNLLNDNDLTEVDEFTHKLKIANNELFRESKKLIQIFISAEEKEIEKIENYIQMNIIQNSQEVNIMNKYVWLKEFLLWHRNSEMSKLKFAVLK